MQGIGCAWHCMSRGRAGRAWHCMIAQGAHGIACREVAQRSMQFDRHVARLNVECPSGPTADAWDISLSGVTTRRDVFSPRLVGVASCLPDFQESLQAVNERLSPRTSTNKPVLLGFLLQVHDMGVWMDRKAKETRVEHAQTFPALWIHRKATDAYAHVHRPWQSARARQRMRGRRGQARPGTEYRPRDDDGAHARALARGAAERTVRAGSARLDSPSPGVRRWRGEHCVASAVAWRSQVDLRARFPAAGAPVHDSVQPRGAREAHLLKGAGPCRTAASILKKYAQC